MAYKVLIVDADARLVANVAATVEAEGWSAATASTFHEGVALFEKVQPDVLVTGVRLGAYNGLHLLVRGVANRPDLPVLIMGPQDPVVEREARELGAAAYMRGPVAASEIVSVIKRIETRNEEEPSRFHLYPALPAYDALVG